MHREMTGQWRNACRGGALRLPQLRLISARCVQYVITNMFGHVAAGRHKWNFQKKGIIHSRALKYSFPAHARDIAHNKHRDGQKCDNDTGGEPKVSVRQNQKRFRVVPRASPFPGSPVVGVQKKIKTERPAREEPLVIGAMDMGAARGLSYLILKAASPAHCFGTANMP